MEIRHVGLEDAIAILGGMPFGYKFVVGEKVEEGALELAVRSKPPPGPSHKDIAETAKFLVSRARGGMLMVSLDGDGLKYVEGESTTLPSGGASEEDFNKALASGMLWLVE